MEGARARREGKIFFFKYKFRSSRGPRRKENFSSSICSCTWYPDHIKVCSVHLIIKFYSFRKNFFTVLEKSCTHEAVYACTRIFLKQYKQYFYKVSIFIFYHKFFFIYLFYKGDWKESKYCLLIIN